MNVQADNLSLLHPSLRPEIMRIERFIPVALHAHAALTPLYLPTNLPINVGIWVLLNAAAAAVLWFLTQRDTQQRFIFHRALYLVSITWLFIQSFGGVTSFFILWLFIINNSYPPLLSRQRATLIVGIAAASYILLFPFAAQGTPFILFVVRAAIITFTGWLSYRVHHYVFSSILEQQNLREQLANAELARQQLEKNKELYEQKMSFITLVSHEFRTPIAIIETAGYLLEQHYERMPQDKRTQRLGDIRAQTARLTQMMDNIVTAEKLFTLATPVRLSAVNLQERAEALIEEMRFLDDQQHNIVSSYEGALDRVFIDLDLMNIIIYQLLSNALKFSSTGSDISVRLSRAKEHVVLQVQNQGIGIPEREGERIFQPFYRADNVTFIKGIGLGLALVYESVQQAGGSIEWDSEAGKATTFTVRIRAFHQSPEKPAV